MARLPYLAAVVGVSSRRVVGWAMAGQVRTAHIEEAIGMCLDHRTAFAGHVLVGARAG